MALNYTPPQSVGLPTSSTLPYGNTLHYPGCGCPAAWRPGTRVADVVDALVQRGYNTFLQKLLVPTRPLRIVYMLPHHNITGGMKCLVEHVRLLRERKHTVIAVHRSDTAARAMPPWTTVEADYDIVCKLHQRLDDVYPVTKVDVVVVGIFHQVAEMLASVPAPVVYWEQGHEWVFGDPVRFQVQHNYLKQDQLFHMVMHLPVALAAVSDAVACILRQEFARTSLSIPNGIDCDRFHPGPRAAINPTTVVRAPNYQPAGADLPRRSILIVGNPALPLKGFDVAISVLSLVHQLLPLSITWVCQTQPTVSALPALETCGLEFNCHVSPSQDELPSLYRGHDAFLFTSRYEAWGMPVIEAMASGLAVVTSNCLGVTTFAQHGLNCLLADPQDVTSLAQQLLAVLTNDVLKEQLQQAARLTALKFTPQHTAEKLEAVLYSLTAVSSELLQLRQLCNQDIQFTCGWAGHACSRTA